MVVLNSSEGESLLFFKVCKMRNIYEVDALNGALGINGTCVIIVHHVWEAFQ